MVFAATADACGVGVPAGAGVPPGAVVTGVGVDAACPQAPTSTTMTPIKAALFVSRISFLLMQR